MVIHKIIVVMQKKRLAELEAEIKIRELEQQLADLEEQNNQDNEES